MPGDFKAELIEIAEMVEPPDCEVSLEAISIAEVCLFEVDRKFGPNSDNPLSYHNAPHSLDSTRRIVRLINILYPYITAEYREGIYDLGFICGGSHDVMRGLGSGKNEKASGQFAVAKVVEMGGPALNTTRFKSRLLEGVQVTEVEERSDGDIVQVNLHKGSDDPLKYAISFGDINGIAMEGSKRVVVDATRLCYEIYGVPTLDQIYKYLSSQQQFIRKRVNDGRVKSDIAYYFPNNTEEIYVDLRKAFHANILAAHNVAKLLNSSDELKASFGLALRGIDLADRSLLVDKILSKL